MKKRLRTQVALLAITCSGIAASTFAYDQYAMLDDCLPLVEYPDQWRHVQQKWLDEEVILVMRHATKCDDALPDCIDGNEGLTEKGEFEAIAVGRGIRAHLGTNFKSLHSPLDRTRDTALLAFGKSEVDVGVSKPCKSSFSSFVAQLPVETNKILVTHSTCIDNLKTPDGQFLLGFSSKKRPHFGVSAFLHRTPEGEQQVLGCMWPKDWAKLEATVPSAIVLKTETLLPPHG